MLFWILKTKLSELQTLALSYSLAALAIVLIFFVDNEDDDDEGGGMLQPVYLGSESWFKQIFQNTFPVTHI